MSISPQEFRKVRERTVEVLQRLTESAFSTSFCYSAEMPTVPIQYWKYEISIWKSDEQWHILECGCFTGSGRLKNSDLGIGAFFENNDRVLDEFFSAYDANQLNELILVLADAEHLLDKETPGCADGGAAINLYGYVFAADEWTRSVCEEYILIIHRDERGSSRLSIGCQQSERYKIKVPAPQGPMFLRVPFDKVQFFHGHERVEGHHNEPYYEYEVALSFAGEDRRYVSRIARYLRQRGMRVFYDEYEKTALWGKDLYVHLDEVYRKRAKFCVLFLSQHYKSKLWTNHERESAQARAFKENREYILPVRLDATEVPGIRPTIGYIDKNDMTPKVLADTIYRKVHGF